MKFKVDLGLPVAWCETVEADSWEEAEKIVKKLVQDESWRGALDLKVNGEETNLYTDEIFLDGIYAVEE